MKSVVEWMKKDIVLCIAWMLAIASAFVVHPSAEYIEYIDFRTLAILWSLMVIVQAFRDRNAFEVIGQSLLKRTEYIWQLATVLIFLCFFSSMFITNDVALITFVPFTIMILKHCDRSDLMIPVIVLQTIAANLGSMMTPIGNPQNLYLYGLSDIEFGSFVALVAPYTVISGVLLAVCIFFLKGRSKKIDSDIDSSEEIDGGFSLVLDAICFIVAILVVLRILPCSILVVAVLAVSLMCHRSTLGKVDYSLLLTFAGFFIFTGNMSNIPAISHGLESVVAGHELLTGVIVSQGISNVPASLLLSGFSDNLTNLILGVNFGGLGTLIASMASLISYKLYAEEAGAQTGRFFIVFTAANLLFLAVLVAAYNVIV